VKAASIVVSDDGLGTNNLTVSGADANFFQIVGTALLLKAGTPLSVFSKPSYSVIVEVDDSTVGSAPDASTTFTLTVTASTGGTPALIISEVAPWSSGNSPVGDDWFEVTNVGTATANITGWKMDDNSNSFGSALELNGVSSIAPGQSVIFIETGSGHTAAGNAAAFRSVWFGGNPPAGLQIGNYTGSGVGLSTGGCGQPLPQRRACCHRSSRRLPSGPVPDLHNAGGRNNTRVGAERRGHHRAFVARLTCKLIAGNDGALPP
jgi:hypothetical protein